MEKEGQSVYDDKDMPVSELCIPTLTLLHDNEVIQRRWAWVVSIVW